MRGAPGCAGGEGSCGFTLPELLLSLGLTASVMALALPFLHAQRALWERTERERETGRALDGAVAWIARDLRQAGYHVPGPAVRSLGGDGIAYVLSRDGDDPAGFSPANRRLVTLFADDGDLKYRVQAPAPPGTGWARGSTQVLAPGIAALSCAALDAQGRQVEDPGDAALVSCTLTSEAGRQRVLAIRLRAPGGAGP